MAVRIYELAHEFDLTTKEVLTAAKEAGLDVKSHSSTIEDDEADKIRRRLTVMVGDEDVDEPVAVAPPPPPPAPKPAPVPELSPEEQLARARSKQVALPTRGAVRPPGRRAPPARPAGEVPAAPAAEAAQPVAEAAAPVAEAAAPAAAVAPQAAPPVEIPAASAPAEAPAAAASAPVAPEVPTTAPAPVAVAVPEAAAPVAEAPAAEEPEAAVEEGAAPGEPVGERFRGVRKPPRPKLAPKPKLAPRPKLAPKPTPHPQAIKEPLAPAPHPQALGVGVPTKKRREAPKRPEKPKSRTAARGPAQPAAPAVPPTPEEVAAAAEKKGRRRGKKTTEEETAEGLRKAQAFRRRERLRKREDFDDVAAGGDTILSPGLSSERARVGRGGRVIMTRPARPAQRAPTPTEGPKKVAVEMPITVKSLSSALGIKASEIIQKLMAKGTLATVNDTLTEEQALEFAVAHETDLEILHEHEPADVIRKIESEPDAPEALKPRSPVVVFMGHVDHGKTSLMDYIRKAHVAKGEAGGITQHIGAYRARVGDRWITFLDTPGHAAFTAMRARGARVTDVAVLVVAADDGVMPQTEEAMNHARAAEVPIVVAINKCDLPQANPLRVKQQLATLGLQTEEWGGKTICVEVSAVTGANVDKLLESLLLEAEMRELKANPDRDALGTVIEAQQTEGFGPIATLLVQNGTLHTGDVVVAGTAYGRVRALKDEHGKRMKEAGPTVPVRVAGLSEVPVAGDRFYVLEGVSAAKQLAEENQRRIRQTSLAALRIPRSLEAVFHQMTTAEVRELPLIIKADVQGSVEALRENLEKIAHPEVRVRVIHAGTGGINESDVLLADASNAIIIGFNTVPDPVARLLAEDRGVSIRQYQIIYDVTDDIRKALEGLLSPKQTEKRLGECNVQKVFKISRVGTVAGCMMTDGVINRNARVRLIRDGRVIFTGGLQSLKRVKDDAREVREGQDCGIHLAGYDDIKVGDRIEAFETESVARTLE